MTKPRRLIVFLIPLIFCAPAAAVRGAGVTQEKMRQLERRLAEVGAAVKIGTLGVLVTDPVMGYSAGYNHNRFWYLASAVKVPVAVEVLRQIELGRICYDRKIKIKDSDRRDGSGEVSYLKSGTEVTVRYLLEQMIIESDNAATDLLIELVGIDNINSTLQKAIPIGFKPVTSLLDVRRYAYSQLHPLALALNGQHYMQIKAAKSYVNRAKTFSKITKTPPQFFKHRTIESAFEAYYNTGANSATLIAYSSLLQKLYKRELISEFVSSELYALMARCKTGKKRIKGGFSAPILFAHKTGTQIGRICDMGILILPSKTTVTVTACLEKWRDLAAAERELANVGRVIVEILGRK